MAQEQWIVQGYLFTNKFEYMKAKKEQEVVAYIKANADLTNIKAVYKVYNNLTEKNTFDTIIGYTFLAELRQWLLQHNIVTEEAILPIRIKQPEVRVNKKTVLDESGKYKELYHKTKQKHHISICMNILLVLVVLAMFMITYYSPRNNDSTLEKEILNKYSTWKMELQEKEDELNAREEALQEVK